jgi:hypothetical protein
MVSKKIFYLVLGATYLSLNISNSAFADSCQASVKNLLKQPAGVMLYPIGENSLLNSDVLIINEAIEHGVPSQNKYSRSINHANMSSYLEVSRKFILGQSEIKTWYQFGTKYGVNDRVILYLVIRAEIYDNGLLMTTITQNREFDNYCTASLSNHYSTKFFYSGDKVNLTQTNFSADGGIEIRHKTIDRALITAKLISDKYSYTNIYPTHDHLDSFSDFDTLDIRCDYDLMSDDTIGFDPLINKSVSFKKFDQTCSSDGLHFVETVFVSTQSPYAKASTVYQDDKEGFTLEEDINEDLWDRTFIKMAMTKFLKSDRFTADEMSANSFQFHLISNRPIEFNNIWAYGSLTQTSVANGKYEYDFVSRKDVTPPA